MRRPRGVYTPNFDLKMGQKSQNRRPKVIFGHTQPITASFFHIGQIRSMHPILILKCGQNLKIGDQKSFWSYSAQNCIKMATLVGQLMFDQKLTLTSKYEFWSSKQIINSENTSPDINLLLSGVCYHDFEVFGDTFGFVEVSAIFELQIAQSRTKMPILMAKNRQKFKIFENLFFDSK